MQYDMIRIAANTFSAGLARSLVAAVLNILAIEQIVCLHYCIICIIRICFERRAFSIERLAVIERHTHYAILFTIQLYCSG